MKKTFLVSICLLFVLSMLACGAEKPAKVTTISLDTTNTKIWFFSDDAFSAENLVITATYENGQTEVIPVSEVEIKAPALAPYGEKEVIVSYREVTASYTIHTALCVSGEEAKERTYTLTKGVTLWAYTVGEGKPFALILPGGGYTMVAETVEGRPYAEKINELGYNAFVLRYTTGTDPDNPLMYRPLEDVALAMNFIMSNGDFFDIDTEGYAVIGSSAGGHLAATWSSLPVGSTNYQLPRPATAILAYAVNHVTENNMTNLLGTQRTEELRKSFSVDENIDSDFPAVYNWVFVEDSLRNHTQMMETALQNAGIPHVSRYFTGGEHGLGLAEGYEAEGWMEEAITFWLKNR